ncbi:sensor histidine kinase [Marinilabiliaceae bacterium JC017]|nr:sensor histidine kinase [Marinilabiliaceae bacterium JC017]
MKKYFARPWLIVVIVIMVPTLLFTAFEIGSLNEDEKNIEAIYGNQLDAILFSINQYADDAVNHWAKQVNDIFLLSREEREKALIQYRQSNPQINNILIGSYINGIPVEAMAEQTDDAGLKAELKQELVAHADKLNRLKGYLKEGYQKIESVDLKGSREQHLFLFMTRDKVEKYYLAGLVINTERFIGDLLSPRIQAVAGEEFIISLVRRDDDRVVYRSLREADNGNGTFSRRKQFWLLPDYDLAIQKRGQTIEELVRHRTYFNIILLVVIDLILLAGAWFLFWNVKREMQLAKIKNDFVSNVSHEIRTPLSLISMYAETLKLNRIASPEKRQKYYDIIFRETQRLAGIVNNILNFSRMESGRRQFFFKPVELNHIVETVLLNYSYHLEKKGFTVSFDAAETLPEIEGDYDAISESFINLLDNAIKYSAEVKKLEITTGKEGEYAFVAIRDYGIGISSKEQKLIFDKFYRVTEGELAHMAKGSGLGLNIVKHNMEAHKGKLVVKSEPGKGSTFIMYFPFGGHRKGDEAEEK